MTQASVPLENVPPRGFGQTGRRDRWWLAPAAVFLVLSAFVAYATWAAVQGDHYRFGPYLSPFYSPEIFGSPHSWFGGWPAWWPAWLRVSPALLVLWAPAGFRLTCYYYRGAYYKAFWADPPGCTVGEPRHAYRGERWFPLVLQNSHRYFMYAGLPFLLVLAHDVWNALWFVDPVTGVTHFGIGVGTLILAVNVVLLANYTLGCHSLRHYVGGWMDLLSRRPVHRTLYACVSCLNRWHMRWAWVSLVWVAFADVYVRLCSTGVWTDLRLL